MDHSTVFSDTLPFVIRLTLFDVAIGSPVASTYLVHINPRDEGARGLSMVQLAVSRGGNYRLRKAAKALVAKATHTKAPEWDAEVGDFLVRVTRRV